MNVKFLDLRYHYESLKSDIDNAIKQVIEDSAFIGGEQSRKFEESFASYHGVEHCVGVANGTDALEIAISSFNFPRGSEIIVPSNSFIASAEAVSNNQCQVVFCDIDNSNLLLDIKDVQRKINSKTRAIIAVHLFGRPCDMHSLLRIGKKHNIKIIEDCAQAHGAELSGIKVGGFGDISTFSFYPGKNLGAYGDAGAILTNNQALADYCRLIANHGRTEKYNHLVIGRNSRLDNIQAAILNVKLESLDKWIDRRNSIALRYIKEFKSINELVLPSITEEFRHSFHLFVIQYSFRDRLADYLNSKGIETGIHYPVSLSKTGAYSQLETKYTQSPKADKVAGNLLSLPIGEHMRDEEVDFVIKTVRDFFAH